jgi:integrase
LETKLTEKGVAALPTPPTGQVKYWDTEDHGFGVVVGQRTKTFVAQGYVGKKRIRVTIGIHGRVRPDGHPWTVALARKQAKEFLAQMANGIDPEPGRRITGPTLADGRDLKLENLKKRRKSQRTIDTFRDEINLFFKDWLDRPIAELTGGDLIKILDGIGKDEDGNPKKKRKGGNPGNPVGAAQVNRCISHISGAWKALDKIHHFKGRNPAEAATKYVLLERETRVAHEDFPEWYARIAKLSEVKSDLHLFMMFTGIRREGACKLRWEHVLQEQKVLRVAKAKGDKAYWIPYSKTVQEILDRRKKRNSVVMKEMGGDEGWVFPSISRAKPFRVIPYSEPKHKPPKQPDPVAERVLVSPHDLRRTYNSVAFEIGAPDRVRDLLMNQNNQGVNMKHYVKPENWDYYAGWQNKIDRAIWKRIKV